MQCLKLVLTSLVFFLGMNVKKTSAKNQDFLSMESALMYDSLLVVAEAVKSLVPIQ